MKTRLFRLLPLVLLATMALIGLGIEAVRFDGPHWLSKAPLLALVVLAFLRRPDPER